MTSYAYGGADWRPSRRWSGVRERRLLTLSLTVAADSPTPSPSSPVSEVGRRPLRAAPATLSRPEREASHKGRALTQPLGPSGRSGYRMGADHSLGLVRGTAARRGGGHQHGYLVQHGSTRRAVALGVDPRPAGGGV